MPSRRACVSTGRRSPWPRNSASRSAQALAKSASVAASSSTIGTPSRRRKRPVCISKRRGRGRRAGGESAELRIGAQASAARGRLLAGARARWTSLACGSLRAPLAGAFGASRCFATRCARAGIPHLRAGGGVASPGAVDREALCCDQGLEQGCVPTRATPRGAVSRSPSAAAGSIAAGPGKAAAARRTG